jgi:hypothetical protein
MRDINADCSHALLQMAQFNAHLNVQFCTQLGKGFRRNRSWTYFCHEKRLLSFTDLFVIF